MLSDQFLPFCLRKLVSKSVKNKYETCLLENINIGISFTFCNHKEYLTSNLWQLVLTFGHGFAQINGTHYLLLIFIYLFAWRQTIWHLVSYYISIIIIVCITIKVCIPPSLLNRVQLVVLYWLHVQCFLLLLKGNAGGDKASGLTSPLTDTTCEILPVFWKTCQAGFKLVTSCVAEHHSSNWANRVAFTYYYYYFYHLYHHHHYQYHYHYCGLLLSPTISRLLLHMRRMYVSSIVWTFCHS